MKVRHAPPSSSFTQSLSLAGLLALWTHTPAQATHLSSSSTSHGVTITEVVHDIRVSHGYVSGVAEIRFEAASGPRNEAQLHFPLPPGAVIHRAELYLPAQERWEAGETLGGKEAKKKNDDAMDDNPDDDPLLVDQIGLDYYRAHVYPIRAGEQMMTAEGRATTGVMGMQTETETETETGTARVMGTVMATGTMVTRGMQTKAMGSTGVRTGQTQPTPPAMAEELPQPAVPRARPGLRRRCSWPCYLAVSGGAVDLRGGVLVGTSS